MGEIRVFLLGSYRITSGHTSIRYWMICGDVLMRCSLFRKVAMRVCLVSRIDGPMHCRKWSDVSGASQLGQVGRVDL